MKNLQRFITSLFGGDEGVPLYGKIALPLLLVGVALLSPGWKDAALAYVNKTNGLGLSLDTPWWVGAGCVFLAVAVFLVGHLTTSRKPAGQFVAIRHQSFQPLTSPLPAEALPLKMRGRRVVTYDCDQSNFLSLGVFDPVGAVRQQQRMITEIAGILKADASAALGYYGIVHIPLQFLAGCGVSSFPQVSLFDLHRETGTWRELQGGSGPDLFVKTVRTIDPAHPIACAIRVEVSYAVRAEDVSEVVGSPYRDYSISIGKPGIDKITHYGQVEEISSAFRKILDEIHAELPSNLVVHVFYSGPVGLGFTLGRRISRTIHNPVVVYNYTASTKPAYAWSVEVTKEGRPEEMVAIHI
ncbi:MULTISPECIES: SAVED domain-containing protein [unclassified Bradyrhizobium]|uniref:SAVED domain-containing protein n=1 Tax=unclassified Bradyrhizobium TaxID=2631580 RepID=UPI00291667C3|nr:MULTISPECIES: SAVED domain-containing protein [unclassified Bradyrhizobium]